MSQNLRDNLSEVNETVLTTSFSGGKERGRCLQIHQMNSVVVMMTKEQVVEQVAIMTEWLSNS